MNPRNAQTGDDGVRRYTWRGVEYPSVTSLRKLVGMPYPLHHWIVNQHLDAAMNLLGAPELDGLPEEEVATALRREANKRRDQAADLGTRVHAAVAEGLVVSALPADEQPLVLQYQDWLSVYRPEVLTAERQVFNLKYGYGGSFDLLYRGGGRLDLCDIKTGSGIYADHILQLLGYMDGEFVGADDAIDSWATDLLHSVEALTILHLRPEGWELVEVHPTAEAMRAFRGMCALARWFDTPDLMSIHTTTLAAGAAPVATTTGAA